MKRITFILLTTTLAIGLIVGSYVYALSFSDRQIAGTRGAASYILVFGPVFTIVFKHWFSDW